MKITTRHCSYLFNNRKDAVICHSARHRSTFRLSATATQTIFPKNGNPYQRAFKNCRLAFTAFLWISTLGQDAVDAFIEAIEIDSSLDTAERLALSAKFPGWTFKRVKSDRFPYVRATRGTEFVGGLNWQDLAKRI